MFKLWKTVVKYVENRTLEFEIKLYYCTVTFRTEIMTTLQLNRKMFLSFKLSLLAILTIEIGFSQTFSLTNQTSIGTYLSDGFIQKTNLAVIVLQKVNP